jgi:hypothetical protein
VNKAFPALGKAGNTTNLVIHEVKENAMETYLIFFDLWFFSHLTFNFSGPQMHCTQIRP